ncbi:MAG: putative integral inner rane protein [Clostridia bacterium]|jgi:hypothetical protein|nr:putative integral inner rane protein [Clostridia bacterium]
MENKKSLQFIKAGIILNLFEYVIILITFLNLYMRFDDFTIMNRYVINKQMQSSSFFQMLQSMLYSGEFINYVIFSVFVLTILYIAFNTIFIILEFIAYCKIKKEENIIIWKNVIIAMGIRGIFYDLSSIPFLIGGLSINASKEIKK